MSEILRIPGWFPEGHRSALERIIEEYHVKSVVEIGSFLGLSAVWFAQRVEEVYCIDEWFEHSTQESNNNLVGTLRRWNLPCDFFSLFRDNVMHSGVWHKIVPVRGNSRRVVERVPVVDLVYVDGDHSYEGCTSDIVNYRTKARGVICGDDYNPNVPEFGVIHAVDELLPQRQVSGTFWWAVL